MAIALTFLAAAPAGAVSWRELVSGTTDEITAIEFQGPGRFWYTTANGDIFKRQGGVATKRYSGSGTRLDDIEFQPGGPVGLAVGAGGLVLRSTDDGDSWTPVTDIPVSRAAAGAMFPDCTASEPLGDVNAVRFSSPTRVWIFAEGSQIARSSGTDTTVGETGTWVDANRDTHGTATGADDTCHIQGAIFNDGFSDGFFSGPDRGVAYIVHGSFADVFLTRDELATDATRRSARAGRGGSPARVLVGDPEHPGRMWSVAPTSSGRSATSYTEDGFSSQSAWTLINPGRRSFPANGPYDVDFAGTVLAVGDDGMILSSRDTGEFAYVDAPAGLADVDWRAVGLADVRDAAVGGVGGRLAVTGDANALPIAGPTPEPGPDQSPGSGNNPTPGAPNGRAQTTIGQPRVRGKRRRRLRLRIAGRVAGPRLCSGRMTISIRKRARTLRAKRAALGRTCRYRVVLRVRHVGRAKRLRMRIRYGGNATALPASATYVLRLRRLKR